MDFAMIEEGVIYMNKLFYTKFHIIIEVISFVLVFAALGVAIYATATIDGEVPTNYDFDGNVTGYGSPGVFLILPIMMFICNGIISLCGHLLPTTSWNMPFKINPERLVIVGRDMAWMLVLLELEIALFTLIFTVDCIYTKIKYLSLIVSVVLCVIFPMITVIIVYIKAKKHNGIS